MVGVSVGVSVGVAVFVGVEVGVCVGVFVGMGVNVASNTDACKVSITRVSAARTATITSCDNVEVAVAATTVDVGVLCCVIVKNWRGCIAFHTINIATAKNASPPAIHVARVLPAVRLAAF